jgi:hypothetical protein
MLKPVSNFCRVNNAKSFCLLFVFCITIFLALVLGFNISVNPYGMYSVNWLNPIVWSERREKLVLLERYPEKIDLLILGSSRTMRLDPVIFNFLTGLKAFNLSVNHARTEDFLALTRYVCAKKSQKPKHLIVGVDMNSFRGFYEIDNLLKYYPELFYFLDNNEQTKVLDDLSIGWNKYVKGLSFHQTVQSFKSISTYLKHGQWENSYRFGQNGLLTYNKLEEKTEGNVRLNKILDQRIVSLQHKTTVFGGFSEKRKVYFEELLGFCNKEDIRVTAVLLPDHPRIVKALKGTSFEKLNKSLKDLLAVVETSYGINIVDASRLESFDGDPNGFFDDIHMTHANSALLVRYIVQEMKKGENDSF